MVYSVQIYLSLFLISSCPVKSGTNIYIRVFFNWDMCEFLGLPGDFRLSIAPSILVWCYSSSLRRSRPIIVEGGNLRRFMKFIMDLIFPTQIRTFSFVTRSVQLIHSILIRHHIPTASSDFSSVSCTARCSQSCKATIHTNVLRNHFYGFIYSFRDQIYFFPNQNKNLWF